MTFAHSSHTYNQTTGVVTCRCNWQGPLSEYGMHVAAMMEPLANRIRRINDIGIGFAGIDEEYVRDIRVYPESGSVQVWVEVYERGRTAVHEAMQYLTPDHAMSFARAFERCAIQALKERSE